jgi:hypothetical protein
MSQGAEYIEVEQPLLDQLLSLGWLHLKGDSYDPTVSNAIRSARFSWRSAYAPSSSS